MNRISESDLFGRVEAILQRSGLGAAQCGAVARTIVGGERDGTKAHGIHRITSVLRTMKAGKVAIHAVPAFVDSTTAAIVRVDAHYGFVNPALELGLPVLAERAKQHGLAALVINHGANFSSLWPEIETLAAHGLASLAMCPSYATVAPAGGSQPLLGTNPLAFGWPRPNKLPFVFDIATSVAARGEIELHRLAGTPVPDGWAIDSDGKPTNDPVAALGGSMLTFGGYKGSAISIMIELLGGILIGDNTSAEALAALGSTALAPTHGELVLALSPDAFQSGSADFATRAEVLFSAIVGQGARLPSQRRFTARAKAATDGIELSDAELARLDDLLKRGLDAID